MSQLIIACIFVASLLVTLLAGVGWAFVTVYLPALLMFSQIPMINIPHAPVAYDYAAMYGMILGIPFRGDPLRLRWCAIDVVMILLLISSTITAWNTEYFETGVNTFRTELLHWIGPYFLARIVFRDIAIRRGALYVLMALLLIITGAALLEFRGQPYFYLHLLKMAGINSRIPAMAYRRYSFVRVSGPVGHPIYFGNLCLGLLGFVAVLAKTTGRNMKSPMVVLTLLCALGCVIMSISYTPYGGLIAATAFFLLLMYFPTARTLVFPATLLVVLGIYFAMYTVAHTKLGPKPDGELPGSIYTRKMIISQSWKKASHAGPFGFGRFLDAQDDDDFDLSSVDNTYMLFTMTRGWVYTTLWVSVGVLFSWRVMGAFRRARHPSQILPLAASTATILGLMISMFSVWAGALYTVVWLLMLGLSNTVIDLILYPELLAPAPGNAKGLISGATGRPGQPAIGLRGAAV